MTYIQERLFALQDRKYRDFQSGLIPNVDKSIFIGVRTPDLKALAKELYKSEAAEEFLHALPHRYFDENQLHSFMLCLEKDFDRCIALTEIFLPYIDNWATCDQTSIKVFQKNREKLLPYIEKWIASDHTFTIRFGVSSYMRYFLGDDFKTEYAERVAAIKSEEYYVNMMIAWYFATALAKNYDEVIGFIERGVLDDFTHNKTIQKACESFRVTEEHKKYLKSLKS